MNLGSVLIWLNAAFLVVYGLAFVSLPEPLGRAITGSAPDTASGVIDMRATYGGMATRRLEGGPLVVPADCTVCGFAAGREFASVVHRDTELVAFLANAPVNPGHLLVIPAVRSGGWIPRTREASLA
ncbi:MAG: hypothetical protein AB1689_10735 [Thermodesulfobacteriota bacterium]